MHHCYQPPGSGFAEKIVERRPKNRRLKPPLEMQQNFEYPVKQPEKHRQIFPLAGATFVIRCKFPDLPTQGKFTWISTSSPVPHRHDGGLPRIQNSTVRGERELA